MSGFRITACAKQTAARCQGSPHVQAAQARERGRTIDLQTKPMSWLPLLGAEFDPLSVILRNTLFVRPGVMAS